MRQLKKRLWYSLERIPKVLFVHSSKQRHLVARARNRKVETHRDGSRVHYFADDNKYSLQDLFEHEKLNSVEDQNEMFIKLAGKAAQGNMGLIFLKRKLE
ncbi:hypothetical protein L9F63_027558 [Diploptera punctata]|uniref:Uncharacterized protein n=1 Tax=Diploptera punctata TaxID=6984 RepID=A0AAD8EKB9_DIPPU|nr:hypothetical protein L9F63_027558 [Diploptera punctata]